MLDWSHLSYLTTFSLLFWTVKKSLTFDSDELFSRDLRKLEYIDILLLSDDLLPLVNLELLDSKREFFKPEFFELFSGVFLKEKFTFFGFF